MRLLSWLFAEQESGEHPYNAEVLCSNWVARPLEQPVGAGHPADRERLLEVDALTFLARIYASQRC